MKRAVGLPASTVKRPVIFYDQSGCGLSDSPHDASVYATQLAADELDAIRHALNLNEIVLYGHSWGSILAIEYLCRGCGPRCRITKVRGPLSPTWRARAVQRTLRVESANPVPS